MITAERAAILKWIGSENSVTWNQLYEKFKGGWEALETWNLIREVSILGEPRPCYTITIAGMEALNEYEAAAVAASGDDAIKIGDSVRYAPNDIMPINGRIGKIVEMYDFKHDDGLVVNCATVEFEKRETFKRGLAIATLEKVANPAESTLQAENDSLKARIAELEALRAEMQAVIAPVLGAVHEYAFNNGRDVRLHINKRIIAITEDSDKSLHVKHLRAIADFARKLGATDE